MVGAVVALAPVTVGGGECPTPGWHPIGQCQANHSANYVVLKIASPPVLVSYLVSELNAQASVRVAYNAGLFVKVS